MKATMNLLEEALLKTSYDRFILLTGLDYPIKTNEYINSFFAKNRNNYLSVRELNKETHVLSGYIQFRDFVPLSKLISFCIRYIPDLKIIKRKDYYEKDGKMYRLWGLAPKWAITKACAQYVLDFYKNNKRFNSYFKYSHAPDDFYFATVIMNSKYKDTVISDYNLFYIHWLSDNKGAKIFNLCDYDELIDSHCLFAKKFSSQDSLQLIEKLNTDS